MTLNRLEIEYFRCLNKYSIEFAPETTVLIGKNGAGKSTLIHAVRKALSFIFKKNATVRDDVTLTSGIPSLRVEAFDKKIDLERNPETGIAYPYISIKAEGTFLQHQLIWELYASTSTFSVQSSRYADAFRRFIQATEESGSWPLLAFYADNFPHIKSSKTQTSKKQSSLRNFGYYQWNEESACSSIWIDKYETVWKQWDRLDRRIKDNSVNIDSADIEKRNALREELNAITDCLRVFTKDDVNLEVKDLFLDVYDEKLCIQSAKGDNPCFEKLPAGYKRLLYIVLDIAYRSYILNKHTQSPGIVVIDEIDLHLHPSLEQNVLLRFRETFPQIQFIVSTHSALVIANLDASGGEGQQRNKVYMMEADAEQPILLPNLYGVDYNATMRDFMNTPARNENVKRLVDEFLFFKEAALHKEAEQTFEKIKELIGEEAATVITTK